MFKHILHSLYTKGLVALINFFLLVISARYLGVSSRGEITVFILNLTIVQIINEVYTGYTLVHFIPKFDLRKLFVNGLVYTLIFSSVSNCILVFIHRQLPGYEWLGYLISLIIILNTFNCVILLGREKIGMYNFLSFLQPLLLLCGLLFSLFVVHDFTFKAYVYPLLFSFSIAIFISMAATLGLVFNHKTSGVFELKPLIVNGLLCQAAILMHLFCNRYSYYVLQGNAKVGLYAAASSLMESVLLISSAIAPILLARIANLGNAEKSAGLALALSKVSVLLSALGVILLLLLPDGLFVGLLGNGFRGTRHLMLLYAPGILMVSLFINIINYFSALGKLKVVLLCYSFGFVTNIIMAPVLIRRYDLAGAAYTANAAYLAVACAVFVAFILNAKISMARLFSLKEDYRILKDLVAAK